MNNPVYTIGHSNLPWPEFVALLKRHEIQRLVDVRTYPGSRHSPQFNREAMRPALSVEGINYQHVPELGGRRRPNKVAVPQVAWWTHPSFAAYAVHALSDPAFLPALIELTTGPRTAIMCAESVWWKCHRRIISDWLTAGHYDVLHIMPDGSTARHRLSAGAVTRAAPLGVAYPGTGGAA